MGSKVSVPFTCSSQYCFLVAIVILSFWSFLSYCLSSAKNDFIDLESSTDVGVVLHGPYDFAFQPSTLCSFLNKIGVKCLSADYEPHPFGDRIDIHFRDCHAVCWERLKEQIDIFHFHEYIPYEGYSALLEMRKSGKCIVIQTHGTEFRPVGEFQRLNAWSEEDDPEMLKKYFLAVKDESVKAKMEWLSTVCNAVITGDWELASYFPDSYTTVIPRSLDLTKIPEPRYPSSSENHVPVVIHAPSNKWVKGSDWVLAAVEALKGEGIQFEYKELHGIPQEKVLSFVQSADIVLDQLRIGWYGIFANEAMALGKCVVVFIREDLVQYVGDPPAVVVANRRTVVDELRRVLVDGKLREMYGRRARQWMEREHNVEVQVPRLKDLYEEVCYRNPPPLDVAKAEHMRQYNEDLRKVPGFFV